MKQMILILSLLCLSLDNFGQVSSEKLFNSFRQGERTNCASIALIKASLEVYGLNNLFTINSDNTDTIKITLKDKSQVILPKSELALADTSAGFKIIQNNQYSRDIVKYALLTYAVMAKHKQDKEKYTTYKEALDDLEYGAFAGDVCKYLGFKKGKQFVQHKRFTGGKLCGLIAWSPAHAVYACDGYMDYHGTKKPLWAKYSGRVQIIK
ncbi:hypothetical protein [Hymenobacter rubripertinctus]|uniref:Peptidase C39-like domain-containing protein n=1 Tax=Hymenobacter rubripertinctus TaxID=2029981 RepID=A0A418R080_9BACT|nr:hypothetical protein [Hymenobacter rubripertinctus]RIY10836.1 hypothetical protein D0T11_09250 [Hymenobacter rubripertinctus]